MLVSQIWSTWFGISKVPVCCVNNGILIPPLINVWKWKHLTWIGIWVENMWCASYLNSKSTIPPRMWTTVPNESTKTYPQWLRVFKQQGMTYTLLLSRLHTVFYSRIRILLFECSFPGKTNCVLFKTLLFDINEVLFNVGTMYKPRWRLYETNILV